MENQFFVLQAELKTGHVLKKDLTIFTSGGDMSEVYQIFETKIQGIEYAKLKQSENPEIEYWVNDSNNQTIFYISKNETKYYD